jgi:hypothetical protein
VYCNFRDAQTTHAQPTSGVKFPVTVPGEKSSMYLMGTAIRVKKIVFVSVQVYAVGLYVDKSSVSKLPGQVRLSRAFRPRSVQPILFFLDDFAQGISPTPSHSHARPPGVGNAF